MVSNVRIMVLMGLKPANIMVGIGLDTVLKPPIINVAVELKKQTPYEKYRKSPIINSS